MGKDLDATAVELRSCLRRSEYGDPLYADGLELQNQLSTERDVSAVDEYRPLVGRRDPGCGAAWSAEESDNQRRFELRRRGAWKDRDARGQRERCNETDSTHSVSPRSQLI